MKKIESVRNLTKKQELMKVWYYLSFMDGCIEANNTKNVCEAFTDE
jgi:hypothetical protein